MTTAALQGEVVPPGEPAGARDVVVIEDELPVAQAAPLALFGDTPGAIVTNMNAISDAIRESLISRGMTTLMSKPGAPERRHVNIEGWTFLLQFVNVRAIIPRDGLVPFQQGDCTRHNPCGWRAYCELRKGNELLGAAWQECSRHENRWASRDEFQVKSMAQTRAIGKACRDTFGFVLAGIPGVSVTPAEEMDDGPPAAPQARDAPAERGAAARQAQAARNAAAPAAPAAPKREFIKTMRDFLKWAQEEHGYDEAKVLQINNVADKDGLRNLGLTKAIEQVTLYRQTVDSRGATATAAAPADDAPPPDDADQGAPE